MSGLPVVDLSALPPLTAYRLLATADEYNYVAPAGQGASHAASARGVRFLIITPPPF